MGLGTVLQHHQAMLLGHFPQRGHVDALPVQMHGQQCLGAGGDGVRDLRGVHEVVVGADVDEDGVAPVPSMATTVGAAVLATVMTSSPGPTPSACSPSLTALVPLSTPAQWRTPW